MLHRCLQLVPTKCSCGAYRYGSCSRLAPVLPLDVTRSTYRTTSVPVGTASAAYSCFPVCFQELLHLWVQLLLQLPASTTLAYMWKVKGKKKLKPECPLSLKGKRAYSTNNRPFVLHNRGREKMPPTVQPSLDSALSTLHLICICKYTHSIQSSSLRNYLRCACVCTVCREKQPAWDNCGNENNNKSWRLRWLKKWKHVAQSR